MIYWPVATPQQFAAQRQRIEAEERERLALESITIDRVTPGEQQSEVDHNFRGENTNAGRFRDRSWRDARGWFSYDLRAEPGVASELLVTYYGGDVGRRFEVLVGDKKAAEVSLAGKKGEVFYVERYPLEVVTGQRVTIKFAAKPTSKTGDPFAQPPAQPITYNHPQDSLPPSLPADLIEVIWTWPNLPGPLKAAVLAIIRSCTP